MKTLEHADYLFCNEFEAAAYSTAHNLETDSHQVIGKHIASYNKSNKKRPRVVIITNGPGVITVVTNMPGSEDFDVNEFQVAEIPDTKIVDTNGAGDAFVGGFFSQIYQG